MSIRIKCRDKPRDGRQRTEDTGLSAFLEDDADACYLCVNQNKESNDVLLENRGVSRPNKRSKH